MPLQECTWQRHIQATLFGIQSRIVNALGFLFCHRFLLFNTNSIDVTIEHYKTVSGPKLDATYHRSVRIQKHGWEICIDRPTKDRAVKNTVYFFSFNHEFTFYRDFCRLQGITCTPHYLPHMTHIIPPLFFHLFLPLHKHILHPYIHRVYRLSPQNRRITKKKKKNF